MTDSSVLYERLIEENMEKGYQVKLVVNEFRDVIYIHIRKYFLSYEGEWIPSKEGISIPASIENIHSLLYGLFDICAKAEGKEVIEYFSEKIKEKQT